MEINKKVKKHIDEKLIKKNAKALFEFYCKQQIHLGVNNTFDYINHEMTTMNIGGCLIFANGVNLLNEDISKKLLISKFKKISEGKR